MDKTEKYNIASIDIHGHGCDVTELKTCSSTRRICD